MPSSPDAYAAFAPAPSAPARRAEAVTPNDTTDLPNLAKALYVGVTGDVRVVPVASPGGAAVTFVGHPVGYMPIQCARVMATGTTAGSLVALFD
ncbi:hypothetical protein ACETK8_06215 [Brevundimonas staleyi]|uniref:Uncharacterized protein n=1 Tax=Brevundimonas staleyi TaxID=74326 RepID=A0ABW0FMU5_9CAUL